jgi:peptidoglycan/xylan/chitin deacetylase (PgdA/CDA1 family)
MFDTLSIVKTPTAARRLFRAALWKVRTREKVIYLTFDDGPIADVTPQVLDQLKKYNAKATFFCIGKNITANPEIYSRLQTEGHTIGNHTQEHQNGWQTANHTYFESIEKCAETIEAHTLIEAHTKHNGTHTGYDTQEAVQTGIFFRPPYGKLTITQYQHLKSKFKIVMWDVLTFDFDLKVSKEQVLDNALQNIVPGSIIVFHDSLKAKEKVLYALPRVLEHYTNLGYRFENLTEL